MKHAFEYGNPPVERAKFNVVWRVAPRHVRPGLVRSTIKPSPAQSPLSHRKSIDLESGRRFQRLLRPLPHLPHTFSRCNRYDALSDSLWFIENSEAVIEEIVAFVYKRCAWRTCRVELQPSFFALCSLSLVCELAQYIVPFDLV